MHEGHAVHHSPGKDLGSGLVHNTLDSFCSTSSMGSMDSMDGIDSVDSMGGRTMSPPPYGQPIIFGTDAGTSGSMPSSAVSRAAAAADSVTVPAHLSSPASSTKAEAGPAANVGSSTKVEAGLRQNRVSIPEEVAGPAASPVSNPKAAAGPAASPVSSTRAAAGATASPVSSTKAEAGPAVRSASSSVPDRSAAARHPSSVVSQPGEDDGGEHEANGDEMTAEEWAEFCGGMDGMD